MFCSMLLDQSLPDQGDISEYTHQRVCHSGHGFDKYIQGYTYNILSDITHSIAGNGCFVSGGALAVTLQDAGFDVFFCVIERTAGVAHEQGAGNRNNGCTDQQAAHIFHAE